MLDTKANKWTILAPLPRDTAVLSANVLNGLIYVVRYGNRDRDLLSFDPARGLWSKLTPTLEIRAGGNSFVFSCLYAAGDLSAPHFSNMERYDVAADTWTTMPDTIGDRTFFASVTVGSEGTAEEQSLFDALIAETST
jgi:hypothetical protein